MTIPSRAGYRHRSGLFPPIRTAFDYCPSPHYVRLGDSGVVRVTIGGVEFPDYGGPRVSVQEAEENVASGDWLHFDPDNVSDWAPVVTGALGRPQVLTTQGAYPAGLALEAWPALAAAREQQIAALEPDPSAIEDLPRYLIAEGGLFGDGERGPYFGELIDGAFYAHHLNGDVREVLGRNLVDWVRVNLDAGRITPFEPLDFLAWERLVLTGGRIRTNDGIEHIPLPAPGAIAAQPELSLAGIAAFTKMVTGDPSVETRIAHLLAMARESGKFQNVPELEMV